MKAILMSIKPKWVKEILNGNKIIEIRKRFPKDYVGWVYIYCTKDKKYANLINRGGFLTGMVAARFWCDKVEELMFLEGLYSPLDRGYCTDTLDNAQVEIKSRVPQESIIDYLYSKGKGYAIHITKLEIFDIPKEISEFKRLLKGNKLDHSIDAINIFGGIQLTKAPQSWCYMEV